MEKVMEGIYMKRMPLPYSFKVVNIYFFEGEHGYTVVDTGDTVLSQDVWEELLRTNIQIEKIVLTHVHPDHCGLAQWLQHKLNVPVMASKQCMTVIDEIKEMANTPRSIFSFLNTYIEIDEPEQQYDMPDVYSFNATHIYDDGDMLQLGHMPFKAIWTPGHSNDQYCFYNEEHAVMIVGDHILSSASPILELRGIPNENPLADYLQSLNKVQQYDTRLMLPGHGELIANAKAKIEALMQRHYARLTQLLAFLQKGPKTGQQIFEHTYAHSDRTFYIEQLISIVSRLLFLEAIGLVETTQQERPLYHARQPYEIEQLNVHFER